MMLRLWRYIPLFIFLGFCFLPAITLAHETVTAGSYQFEIGWVKEPVLVGQPNGLDLFIASAAASGPDDVTGEHDHEAETGEHDHAADAAESDQAGGVTGAEAGLTFAVEYGGVNHTYALRPVGDQPGHYTADLIPTRAGQYTFHLTGAINGEAVEVKVEPEEVVSADTLAFPEPLAAPADFTAQLATVQNQARTTQMIAIAGAVLGLLGTGLGVYGLLKK